MTKATRKNRIYLDYLRNDREATAIAPFSPRARAGAPVAMPLQWKELDSARAPAFHVLDFRKMEDAVGQLIRGASCHETDQSFRISSAQSEPR